MKREEKLQILISTMNLKNDEEVKNLLNKMKVQSDYLVINQVKNKQEICIQNEKVISATQYGLSLSRNLAMENATSNLILLADDDLVYVDEYQEIIEEAYRKNSKADVICFWVKSRNPKRKVKKLPSGKIGYIKTMRICSFQISMRRDSVKEIKFDEKFGAGSVYNRGEESIFLCDCLRQGLKIKFVNQKIAEVEQKESTWYNGYSEEYFEKQGEIFKRMYPKFYKIIMLQFAIRKYPQYRKEVTFKKALEKLFLVD